MKYNRISENNVELRELFRQLQNRKVEDDGARFEDVSPELAELDRLGKVDYSCYTDYYQMAQNRSGDKKPIPLGPKANNGNYKS